MATPAHHPGILQFGDFSLEAATAELRRNGVPVKLAYQPARILVLLASRSGETVTREDIVRHIWGSDTFVGFDQGLNSAIRQIRTALEDDADHPKFIETIPKRGYRFLATVEAEVQQARRVENSLTLPSAVEPVVSEPPIPPAKTPGAGGAYRRILLGLFSVIAIAFIVGELTGVLHVPTRSGPSAAQIRIAVLPFQNLTGHADQDYVSDGFTEEVITKLGQLNPSQVAVIARTSAMSYKGTNKPVSVIARELRVDYVLEGSVRSLPDGFRVTAQLIRADDQTHLWAQDYDRSFGGLVPIQAEVAQTVAREIQVKLTPQSNVVFAKTQDINPESYRAYLQGNYLLASRTGDGLTKAVSSFEEAIEKDPNYAPAYAGLANAYSLLIYYGYPPGRAGIPKAKAAAEKAIELDPGYARGHASLAYVYYMWEWRLEDAQQEFRKAIELDPNDSTAHHWYAQFLSTLGRADESMAQIRIAEQLDPRSLIVTTAHGYFAYFARRYDEASAQCQLVLRDNPDFIVAHSVMGLVDEQQNAPDKAVTEFQRVLELSGNRAAPYLDYLGHAYALSGKRKQAEAILAELDKQIKNGQAGPAHRAATLVALGRKQEALQALEQGFIDGEGVVSCIRVDPRFDPLRKDPRFLELANRFRVSR